MTRNNSRINYSTDLVLYGNYLPSLVGNPRLGPSVSSMIELTNYTLSILVGLVLSDGCISLSTGTGKGILNGRLMFSQGILHFPFFWFVFCQLAHYCKSIPITSTHLIKGLRYTTIGLVTRALPCFTVLHRLFYNSSGVKVIPVNQIYELLTPVALAFWIIGDGATNPFGLRLCTDSFSVQDVVRLINVLIIRYNLKCSLHTIKGNYRIYIKSESIPLLRTIVLPYIHPSIIYKVYSLPTHSYIKQA